MLKNNLVRQNTHCPAFNNKLRVCIEHYLLDIVVKNVMKNCFNAVLIMLLTTFFQLIQHNTVHDS